MKTLKRIFSLLITITLIMSFGLCAYAESSAELTILEANGTSKSVYLEFNIPVQSDVSADNFTVTDKDGASIEVDSVSLSTDKKIVNIIFKNAFTVKENETNSVNVTVKDILSEDGEQVYLGGKATVTYTGKVFDDFESYNELSELNDHYLVVKEDNWKGDKQVTSYSYFSLDNGRLKIAGIPTSYKFMNKYVDTYAVKKKNYTCELDVEQAAQDTKRIRFCINDYQVWASSTNFNLNASNLEFTSYQIMENETNRNAIPVTNDQAYSIAMSMKPASNTANGPDVFDIFYNSKNLFHENGTVKLGGYPAAGIFHFMSFDYTTQWIDNFRIYETRSAIDETSAVKAIFGNIGEPQITGTFDADQTVTVEHNEPTSGGFDSEYSYRWLKSDDQTKDYSEWTEVTNDNDDKSTFTLTTENCDFTKDFFVCEITRTVTQTGGSYSKVFKEYSNVACKPFIPVCKEINFTYNKGETASTLKAIPTYFDQNGDLEDKANATFVWEVSKDKQNWTAYEGTFTDADDYKGNVIDVTDMTGKFVRCTATLKALTGDNDTLTSVAYPEIYTLPFKPVASNVSISGTSTIGSVLKASYTYYDENGDSENIDKTEKIWYRKSGTTETKIGEGLSYAITSADAGSAIIFKVTPKNDTYPDTGDTVESSNSVSVAVIVTGGTIGGTTGGFSSSSSGGGSYSSSSTVTTTPTNPEFKPVPEEKEPAFSDIKGHWAKDTIEKLNEKGLVNGKENGFEPDSALTRAEWITLLLRAIGADFESVEVKDNFGDVNQDDWYAKAVQFAFDNNLVSGTDGNFNPNDNVTREQMAKMLIDALEYFLGEEIDTDELSFTDNASISSWAEQYVQKAVSKGLITGTPEGAFNPSSQATRAEACTVLLRLLNVIGK